MRSRFLILSSVVTVTLLSLLALSIRSASRVLEPQVRFLPSPTSAPTPTSTPTVTLGLVGDLGLGRHITSTARSKGDFSWSFQKIGPWLLQNDFTLANLESPITDPCPEGKTGTFTFCGDKQFVPYLLENKFVLSLSNNHILNYGQKGLTQTYDFLTAANIPYYYQEFNSKTVNGITFGFLGYDFVTYPDVIASKAKQSQILETIQSYDSQVDWLIVSLHWGNEYLPQPENWRVKFAREMVEAGADIIHGHHPHVWQGSEIYQDKPIFYSLGNFIFDQSWSYETSHTNIVRLTLTQHKVLNSQTFPVEIKFNSQPVLMP